MDLTTPLRVMPQTQTLMVMYPSRATVASIELFSSIVRWSVLRLDRPWRKRGQTIKHRDGTIPILLLDPAVWFLWRVFANRTSQLWCIVSRISSPVWVNRGNRAVWACSFVKPG